MSKEFETMVENKFVSIDGQFKMFEKKFEQIDRRFEEVDKRFEQIDRRFEEMDKRFEQIDRRFEEVDKRFERIEKRLDSIEEIVKIIPDMQRSILLIEDQVMTKIPALFEAYTMQYDKQERQQEEIEALSIQVQNHEIRISSLEQKNI